MNEDGSDSSYGFGYTGSGNRLYVFEAPIDLLSFLSLYPKDWEKNSYIVLNGVAEHAMLQMLRDYSNLDTIILCLDHDPAGIEACGRLAEILAQNGYTKVRSLKPAFKDWNEDLKNLNGEEAAPAKEHPKVTECEAWISVLKQVAESVDMKYATKEYICRYYQEIYNALKKGRAKENLEEAFDEAGLLLGGVLVRCMEKEGRTLGKETDSVQILDNLQKRYRPHRDKGSFHTRIRNMQKAYVETKEVFDTKDLSIKENKELLVKKCMSLTMECSADGIYSVRGFKGTYEVTVQVGDVEQKFDLTLSDEKAALNLVYDGNTVTKASDIQNPDTHAHVYEENWKTDEEKHWKECSVCDEPEELENHTFGEWIVEAEPSTTQAGIMYCECSVCGYRKTESIAPHAHTYGENWKTDEEKHWKECSICGESEELEDHAFGEWVVETEPSTTQAGIVYCECNVCGYRKTDTIAQLAPQGLWIAGVEEDGYSYTGSAIKPQIRVYDHGTLLQEKKDYTICYKNNLKANSGIDKKTAPTIIVTGKGNYSGKEAVTFKILPVDLSNESITADSITVEYNKKVQKVLPTVTYNGKKLANKKDFTVSYPALESGMAGAFQEPGEYEVLIKANKNGNFSGLKIVKFTIAKGVLISKTSVAKVPDAAYTGNPMEPKPVVKMKGKTLTEGTDYKLRYENNTEVGTATIVLTGINDYVGTKKIFFKITGKPLGRAVVMGLSNGIYNGKEQFGNITVSLNGETLAVGTDYEVSYANHKNAGIATVTIKGINGYTGTVKKTFKIAAYDIGNDTDQMIEGLPENLHTKYMKGGGKPEISLTFNGMRMIDGKDYSISYKNNTAVTKSASMIIKGKGNFKGTIQRTFTIEKKSFNDAQYPVTMQAPDIAFSGKAGKYISTPNSYGC